MSNEFSVRSLDWAIGKVKDPDGVVLYPESICEIMKEAKEEIERLRSLYEGKIKAEGE